MGKSRKEKIKIIDLFAGIGGTRLGFERAGCVSVFSSEWDKECQKTYEAAFGEVPAGDITKIGVDEIPPFNILVAGFPCQPFSSIGKRQGFLHPTQGTLFYNIVKILESHEPEAFLLENVQGLKTHNGGITYKTIKESLDKLNYWVFDDILNASDYGVPQSRKRIYLVGFSKKLGHRDAISFDFKKLKKEKPVFINKFLEKGVKDRSISEHLQKKYIFKNDDGRAQILTKNGRDVSKTLVATYHKIQRLTGIFVKDGPTGLRLLTEKECRAVMGFPLDYKEYPKVPVSRTQMYRQFGNSVAVPVIEKIAKLMVRRLRVLMAK